MIKHIPHAGKDIPDKYKERFEGFEPVCDDNVLTIFHDKWVGDELVFVHSKMFCDVARKPRDKMNSVGLGICYANYIDGRPLPKISQDEKNEIINDFYVPHHEKLVESIADELEMRGRAIIVNCYTYPKTQMFYEKNQRHYEVLISYSENSLGFAQYIRGRLNKSFDAHLTKAGSLCPRKYAKNPNVYSVSIWFRQDVDVKKANWAVNNALSRLDEIDGLTYKQHDALASNEKIINRVVYDYFKQDDPKEWEKAMKYAQKTLKEQETFKRRMQHGKEYYLDRKTGFYRA